MAAQDSGSEFAGAAITYLPLLVAIVMSITLRMLIANIDSIVEPVGLLTHCV